MAALIAYYSHAGENYFGGSYRHIKVGNTEKAARMLAEITGADMLRIEQAEHYSDNYNECIAQAKADLKANARPEVIGLPDNIDKYDEIYLGYPNYWVTMPMAVYIHFLKFNGPRGDFYKNMFAKCPAGRPGTADEVANAAELLMTDRGAFITGSTLLMDGGATANYYYDPLKPNKEN